MDEDEGRGFALAKIGQEMAARGWNTADLARAASIDVGTAGDLLNGGRWPRRATQNKIELAFGWWPGSISYYARGEEPPVEPGLGIVSTPDQDAGVLLSMPPEALEGLGPAERAEVISAAQHRALQVAREIRRRLDAEAQER